MWGDKESGRDKENERDKGVKVDFMIFDWHPSTKREETPGGQF